MFETYLQLGFDHILDIKGYDHMLFLLALCAGYGPRHWKPVLILVTAFTLGHSLTLALAALNIVLVPSDIIEFLIPLTIFLTAVSNVTGRKTGEKTSLIHYALTAFFGLIHGFGFSNFFRALLGREEDIVLPLLAFNLGVELGQVCVVAGILLVTFVVLQLFRTRRRDWIIFLSGAAAGIALILMAETKFW